MKIASAYLAALSPYAAKATQSTEPDDPLASADTSTGINLELSALVYRLVLWFESLATRSPLLTSRKRSGVDIAASIGNDELAETRAQHQISTDEANPC